jgi:cell division septation protein DedD
LVYTSRVTSSVKERLTGALILIVALVIVVPELFSGRPTQRPATEAPDAQSADAGPPLRSYTMDLDAGQKGQPAKEPTPAVVEAQVPAAKAKQADVPPAASPPLVVPEPTLPAAKPVEAPAARPAPAPPVAAAQGWWVQLGSFSARANADRLVATLTSAGYSLRVSPTKKNGKELYRVLAGPSEDRAAAVALQARLGAAGHKGTLVAP